MLRPVTLKQLGAPLLLLLLAAESGAIEGGAAGALPAAPVATIDAGGGIELDGTTCSLQRSACGGIPDSSGGIPDSSGGIPESSGLGVTARVVQATIEAASVVRVTVGPDTVEWLHPVGRESHSSMGPIGGCETHLPASTRLPSSFVPWAAVRVAAARAASISPCEAVTSEREGFSGMSVGAVCRALGGNVTCDVGLPGDVTTTCVSTCGALWIDDEHEGRPRGLDMSGLVSVTLSPTSLLVPFLI